MSIQGVSATTDPYLSKMQGDFSARRDEFKNLATAIQSGDLKSAQDAYSKIQSSFKSSQGATGSQASGIQDQLSNDFAAMGKSLQSGDVNAAQDAFKKLAQDMQAAGKSHHHHHHGAKPPSQAVTPASVASTIDTTNKDKDSSGYKVDILL